MIQLISIKNRGIRHGEKTIKSKNIFTSTINTPQSLDEFRINIIDLSGRELWRNNGKDYSRINSANDIESLYEIISRRSNSQIVLILPQNISMLYHWAYDPINRQHNYKYGIELKNMLKEVFTLVNSVVPKFQYNIIFEPTTTNLNIEAAKAEFYFNIEDNNLIITSSIGGSKATTVRVDESIIATTLELDTEEKIFEFLDHVGLLEEKSKKPEWVENINILDDIEQKIIVLETEEEIEKLEKKCNVSKSVIVKNHQYKSVLYESGAELENRVIEIIEIILESDLSSFVDQRKEDFLIKFENITFIGEIKGANKNVKNSYIGQLNQHYESYLDDLELGNDENVKQLLIVNHQRFEIPSERLPINERQKKLAELYESLIIETSTLLEILERKINNKISTEEVIELFKTSNGLLVLE